MIIYRQAQAAWYLTLIMCQFWHIWVCKTRLVSVFQHGFFHNKITLFGVMIALCVMCMVCSIPSSRHASMALLRTLTPRLGLVPQVVYIPALNNLFYTNAVIGVAWLFNLGFGVFIFAYTEVVKYYARRDPEGFVARHVAW